jgi:hypothetical protein
VDRALCVGCQSNGRDSRTITTNWHFISSIEVTFLLSATLKPMEIVHLSSVGYLKPMKITVSSVGQLRPTDVVVLSSIFREADGNYFGR